MKVTVFTAIFGEGFVLHDPTVTTGNYVCFTDQPLESDVWTIGKLPQTSIPQYEARRMKTQWATFLDCDVSIWLDSRFTLTCDPAELAAEMCDAGDYVAAMKHPDRTPPLTSPLESSWDPPLVEEARAIAELGKADKTRVMAQLAHYQEEWTTMRDDALTTTGLLVRRNDPKVAAFDKAWWHEIDTWTLRDQMSVDYAAWKAGLDIHYLRGHYRANPYAVWSKP